MATTQHDDDFEPDDFEPETEAPSPTGPRTTEAEAFGLGAADTASMGFSDELAGSGANLASTAFGRWLSRYVPGARTMAPGDEADVPRAAGRGIAAPISDVSDYEAARDQWRANQAAAERQHEGWYRTGQATGIAGTALAPIPGSGGVAKALGAATPLVQRGVTAAVTGGALGGLNALGDSEASLTRDPSAVAGDVALGVGTGAAMGPIVSEAVHFAPAAARYVGGKAAGAAEYVGGKLGKAANSEAVAAAGPYGGDSRKLVRDFGAGAIDDLGRNIREAGLDEGAGRLGKVIPQGWETYAANSEKQLAELGPRIGEVTQKADAAGVRINVRKIADDMLDEAADLASAPDAALQSKAESIFRDAAMLSERGEMSFAEAVAFRRKLDEMAFDEAAAGQSALAKAARAKASSMRKAIDEALSDADPALRAELHNLNSRYSAAARTHKYASTRVAKETGLQVGGLTGKLALYGTAIPQMISGDIAGGLQTGTAAYLADKFIKERGHDALSKIAGGGEIAMGALSSGARKLGTNPAAQQVADKVAPRAGRAAIALAPSAVRPQTVEQMADGDPHYGPMLAEKSPEERRTAYAVLMETDSEFRTRQRERARQLQEESRQ